MSADDKKYGSMSKVAREALACERRWPIDPERRVRRDDVKYHNSNCLEVIKTVVVT